MAKLAANLTMLFQEHPFLERFAAARRAGLSAVEFLFPYDHPQEQVKAALADNDLDVVLFNFPAGDWNGGDRGIAAHPQRVEEFRAGVKRALEWARILGVRRLNALAGKLDPQLDWVAQRTTLIENLIYAADAVAADGITVLLEPINNKDIPGFSVTTSREALSILDEAQRPNLALQYDLYHAQRMEGDLIETLRLHLDRIAHLQLADCPGRHQPGTGEINYRFVFAELDRIGYQGYVGLEYVPTPDTVSSLSWVSAHGLEL